MKKFLSILLVFAMLLAVAVPAAAADEFYGEEGTEFEPVVYTSGAEMVYYVGGIGATSVTYRCDVEYYVDGEKRFYSERCELYYGHPVIGNWPTEEGTYNFEFEEVISADGQMFTATVPVTITVLAIPEASGKCGENMNWSFDFDTYTLTISGTGDMYLIAESIDAYWNEEYNFVPAWWDLPVKHIVIEDGVENISSFAFFQSWNYDYDFIESIVFPETLKSIPEYGFFVSTSITELVIPEGVTSLTGWPFGSPGNSFTSLTELYLPSTLTEIDYISIFVSGVNYENGGLSLEKIHYAGTEEQWNAIARVDSEGIKTLFGDDYDYFYENWCVPAKDLVESIVVFEPVEEEIVIENGSAVVPDSFVEVVEGKDVVIDVTETEEKVESVVIGSDTVEKIADVKAAIEIKLPDVSVSFDKEAVSSIGEQAVSKPVTIVATEVEEASLNEEQRAALAENKVCAVLNLEAYAGDTKVTEFGGGKVTVSVPFELPEGTKAEDFKVYYIDDNGNLTAHDTKYENGCLVFTTTHFSDYVVVNVGYDADVTGVTRLAGADRYATAFLAADTLKERLGVAKFNTVIVASGTGFADALAGSYLAAVKDAPILLVRSANVNTVKDYIRANLASGGTVYLLGGVNAVPKSMETGLDGFTVKRLGGADRYATNLLILKEAGVGSNDIIVCTGKNFADSLSASATGLPILLVKDSLNASQKEFLATASGKIIIVGGNNAVNTTIEKQLKSYGSVARLAGNTRYDTSVLVAKEFFSEPTTAVLAYAQNFPDGLSGGPLAYNLQAPLILTDSNKSTAAVKYVNGCGIKTGYVLGGSGLISDKVVKNIFSMSADNTIIVK